MIAKDLLLQGVKPFAIMGNALAVHDRGISGGRAMSEQLSSLPTCAMSSWDELVHPDDHAAVEEARQR